MIKKKYLYSIGEICRKRLLISAKANSPLTILGAIKRGELKAFKSIRGGNTYYNITGEELDRFRKKRIKEIYLSPIPAWQRTYARNKSKKDGILYLKERGYSNSDIARCIKVSRQYVNEIIK